MKNYNLFVYFFIFLFLSSAYAQKDTLWYDANWSKTSKAQASYFRPAPNKKDNGYWMIDYYMDGTKQMQALSLKENEEFFDGEVTWYYPNGNVMQTVNYKNNIPEGLRKNYHESGSLKSEYSYKQGKISGKWVAYYENAILAETGQYKNGERTNTWKEYYKNGKLKGEGNYDNDKKVGVWKMYYYKGVEEDL